MTELSLNVLDVAQNSIRAGATLIEISVTADVAADVLSIVIKDNGCGMTEEQVKMVCDPFYTTRTTRKVGLGIPFYKQAAESTGGSFSITSQIKKGTTVSASFTLSHIDRMPLGDMTSTIFTLVTFNKDIDFLYKYKLNDREFTLDTREFREILGEGYDFGLPEVSDFIKSYLIENKAEVDNGLVI